MAMKMDRRAFLKTSAAMAVAVSMTGLLGGCSDGDGSTKFGRFQATVGALREKDNAMVGGVAAFRLPGFRHSGSKGTAF